MPVVYDFFGNPHPAAFGLPLDGRAAAHRPRSNVPQEPPLGLPAQGPPAVRRGREGVGTEPGQVSDPLRLRLVVQPGGGAWGLIAEGELDIDTAPSLRDAVTELGRAGASPDRDCDSLLLDLSGVTFIDTRGAHALKGIDTYAAAHGVRLHVTPPASRGPRALLRYAVTTGWLAPRFTPEEPPQPRGTTCARQSRPRVPAQADRPA